MNDVPPRETLARRRRALKTALGGFSAVVVTDNLPEQWLKPTFSTAVLPAHASLSGRVVLESFNASEEEPSSEAINVSIEFFTRDVPDGAEVIVAYSSGDRLLSEGDIGDETVYTFEAEIENTPEGMGIPFWTEGPVGEVEVAAGTTAGTEITAEITVEGFDPVQFFTETSSAS